VLSLAFSLFLFLFCFTIPHGGTFIKATQGEQYTDATSFVRSLRSRWKQLPWEWSIDAKSYLCVEELDNTLKSPTLRNLPPTSKWKAFFILMRHLDIFLGQQYIQIDDPHNLWEQLEARFHHKKTIYFSHARNDWIYLGVMVFPNSLVYNTKLHRITT
jgi:hypothetical protein